MQHKLRGGLAHCINFSEQHAVEQQVRSTKAVQRMFWHTMCFVWNMSFGYFICHLSQIIISASSFAGWPSYIAMIGPSRAGSHCTGIFTVKDFGKRLRFCRQSFGKYLFDTSDNFHILFIHIKRKFQYIYKCCSSEEVILIFILFRWDVVLSGGGN